MLTIRDEQLRLLARARLRAWLLNYLQSCYPAQFERLSGSLPAALDEVLRWCDAQGLREAAAMRKYAHVSFVLGQGFQAKPEYGWARRILESDEWPDVAERVAVLEEAMIDRLRMGVLFA